MGLTCFKSWKQERAGQKGGNRDVLASPGSYFFLSNSCGQGEEWLKTINKGVWIPFTGVFGQRLEETVLYERRYGQHQAPLVVEQCVDFIREQGLHEVGLFRQPGQATLVKELQQAFDAGEKPSFDSSTDVHTVASLLKLYLRELPEPLVPFSRYHDFLLCGKKLSCNRTQGLVELRSLLHDLPVANFNLLHYICRFLSEVQSCSNSNKMSTQNLATVFGPNILRPKAEDPLSIITGATVVQQLMLELIREHPSLFSTQPDRLGRTAAQPSAPHQPRASACPRHLSLPLLTERRTRGGSSSSSPRDGALAPSRQPSSAARIQLASGGRSPPLAPKRLLGHRQTSSHPEACLFPVPSTSYHTDDTRAPAALSTCRAERSASGSRPKPGPQGWGEAGKDLPPGARGGSGTEAGRKAPPGGGVAPGTASGGSSEAQDSTLSVYDNLDNGEVSRRTQEVTEPGEAGSTSAADSSSSWSSCEGLPLDEAGGGGASPGALPRRRGSARFYSFRTDAGEEEEGDGDEGGDDGRRRNVTSQTSSYSPTDGLLSTGSSDVFLPSAPPDPQGAQLQLQPQQVHSLLAGLREQMAKQEAEFQARIHSLEECNVTLEGQVASLRASLTQQRRWHSVAKIKMRNVERARADAERHNATLQKDMEQFFRSFSRQEPTSERNVQSF
ncbi:rho GTPase-activating protein 24 [Aplochiton taeniatus]